MNEGLQLTGGVTVSRRLAGHWIWTREPLCAGAAWIDLLMLARTEPGEITVNGSTVALERGDVGWAQYSLALRWKRSPEWVARLLSECADRSMVELRRVCPNNPRRGSVIRILNYEAYNCPKPITEPESGPATEPITEPESKPAQSRKREEEVRKGEGAAAGFSEIPDNLTVAEYCAEFKDLSVGIEAGIPEVWWTGWLAMKLDGRGPFPRDWKRAIALAHRSDWMNANSPGHGKAHGVDYKKNAPPAAGYSGRLDGQSPAQARFLLGRELEAVQQRLEDAFDLNVPAAPEDVAREKQLKEKLRTLGDPEFPSAMSAGGVETPTNQQGTK